MSGPSAPELPVVARLFGPPPGLGGVLFAVYGGSAVVLLVLADRQGAPHVVGWMGLIALLAAGALAFFTRGHPLAGRTAWIATGLAAAASAIPFADPPDEASGYAPWYIRTGTVLFSALILRARPIQAWLGAGVSYALLIGWGLTAGAPFGAWGGVVLRQLATIVAIQVFALLLVRLSRAAAAYRAEERDRIAATERRAASVRERRTELAAIRSLVDPILTTLASGGYAREDRELAGLLAAELRDRLRGRSLVSGGVSSAAREARRRGVDVVLLDDSGDSETSGQRRAPLDPGELAAGLEWAAGRLAAANGPRVTVRLSREPGGRPVLTVVSGDDSANIEERVL